MRLTDNHVVHSSCILSSINSLQNSINSLHFYVCFIFFILLSAVLSTSWGLTWAANLSEVKMASCISSELSSKWTNIAPIIYSKVDSVSLMYRQLKNTLIAVAIFFLIGSWESSSLSNKSGYSYLSWSVSITYLR